MNNDEHLWEIMARLSDWAGNHTYNMIRGVFSAMIILSDVNVVKNNGRSRFSILVKNFLY